MCLHLYIQLHHLPSLSAFKTLFNFSAVTMQQAIHIFSSLAAAGLLPAVLAIPAPPMSYEGETGPVAGVSPPIPTATGFSGSLYGDESLLGEVAKPSPVFGGDWAIVSDYALANGQEAGLDLGLYLDFNSVEIPQPIRGTGGQTQPGPSKSITNTEVIAQTLL